MSRYPHQRSGGPRAGRRIRPFGRLLPAVALAVLAVGCRQDMHDAPKYEPLEASAFFADGRASRSPVPGTVARGQLMADTPFYTGKDADGQLLARVPVPVSRELLLRGQERFNIFCSPCHDRAGTGNGMIVRRGYKRPQPFHIDRLRAVEDGYFFDVITNGFGQMPSYAAQVKVEDRWAIAAYIRVLQLSQNAPVSALTAADVEAIEAAAAAHEAPAAHEETGGH